MTPVLQADALRVGPASQPLGPLTFALAAGDALRLLGPSGCGKTTVLRALSRLGASRGGELRLQGVPAGEMGPARWRSRVAFLPQAPVMLPGNVGDNLRAGFETRSRAGARFDQPRAEALMRRLDLDVQLLLGRNAQLLSGGEAARVALCRALLIEPRVLLADELCAQLDRQRAQQVAEVCAEFSANGGSIVLTAHDVTPWASLGDRLRSVDLTALGAHPPVGETRAS